MNATTETKQSAGTCGRPLSAKGNPSLGRPLSARGVRALAGRRAKEAIAALAQVAGDDNAPTADRVSAAQTLLAHAIQPEHA